MTSSSNNETIGIAGIGYYIPQMIVTSREIAEKADIPLEVLTQKIGMKSKRVASPDEQPSEMALAAAREAMEKARITPDEIDIVIFAGSAPQDYLFWSASARLQHSLGAVNSLAFEVSNGCNGLNLGIQIAKDLLLGNPWRKNALVVYADKFSPFLSYGRKEDLSLFHLSDAAGAAIVRKNEPSNRILTYFQMTDGSYSNYVKISNGGAAHPCSLEQPCEDQTFSIENALEFSSLLSEVYTENYLTAIRRALEQSGHTPDDIDFLFTNQVKASTMNAILDAMNIPPSNTLRSIEEYGHMGAVDTMYALSRFIEGKKIPPNSLVVLASSAVGFSWSAMVLQF